MPHGQAAKQGNKSLRSCVGVYKYLEGTLCSRLIARTIRGAFRLTHLICISPYHMVSNLSSASSRLNSILDPGSRS